MGVGSQEELVSANTSKEYGAASNQGDDIGTPLLKVLSTIGVGRAQYIYWAIISSATFVDFADMVVIAAIVPILKCEWDLDVIWETLISTCGFFFNTLTGAVLCKLPDKYGRKMVISVALFCQFLAVAASAVAQNKMQFLVLRSLTGITAGLTFPTAIVFSTEIVQNSHREVGPLIIQLVVASSEFCIAVAAFLILNLMGWRWFVFLVSCPLLVCFTLLIWVVPESPRFLVVSGHAEKAVKVVRDMASLNRVQLPDDMSLTVHRNKNLGSITDAFKPEYRKETVLMSIMFFCNLLIIFGAVVFIPLALYSGFCGGSAAPPQNQCVEVKQNSLLQLAAACLGSLLAALAGYTLATKIGRSISMKVFSTGSVITILFFFKCFSELTTTTLFFLLKFFQYSHHINMFFIIPEFYPTTFRNTALGVINSCGKLGGIFGAGLVYLFYYQSAYLVIWMFLTAGCVTCVCSWVWNTETEDSAIRDVEEEEFKM
ncbi:hypothetical protein ACHWQZ_G018997 [Mnemiopsis leidyi]